MLIAVDGGATHCRLALFDDAGCRVSESHIEQPASLTVSVEQADRVVREGIDALAREAGVTLEDVPLACGLAGSLRVALKRRFIEQFADERVVNVWTDGHAQLAGVTGGGPGACLAVGTGSVIHWQTSAGEVGMAGGWGYPVGDEASAAWLGMHVLQEYVRAIDRKEVLTPLWHALGETVGTSVEDIQAWTTCSRSSTIGSLAMLVSQHAESGDASATRLLDRGADECEQLIAVAPDKLPLWICGGLCKTYEPLLRARGYRFEDIRGDALDGLRRLALLSTHS